MYSSYFRLFTLGFNPCTSSAVGGNGFSEGKRNAVFAREAHAQPLTAGSIRADRAQASTSGGKGSKILLNGRTKVFIITQCILCPDFGRRQKPSVRKHEVPSLASRRWSCSALHGNNTIETQWTYFFWRGLSRAALWVSGDHSVLTSSFVDPRAQGTRHIYQVHNRYLVLVRSISRRGEVRHQDF